MVKGLVDSVKLIGTAIKAARSLALIERGIAITKAWSAAMSGPTALLTGGLAGLAIGAALTAAIIGATQIGDGAFPASGKSMVSTREGGIYEPSQNDDIAVGPGIINRLKSPNIKPVGIVQSAPSSPTINNDALGKVIGEHVANALRQTPVQTIFPDQEYGRRYNKTIGGMTARNI